MSKLKKMTSGRPAHSRIIDMRTYAVDENSVVVEGELRDDRYHHVYDLTGKKLSGGAVHHLLLRLLIREDSMKIEEVEAEMLQTPHEECLSVLESIDDIVGLEIKKGFVKKVMERTGGVKGCAHLTHLLTVMSQEVFQGVIAKQRKNRRPVPETLEAIPGLEYLINSCKMWKKEGLKLALLRDTLEASK